MSKKITFPLRSTSSAALRTPSQACLSHGFLALVETKMMSDDVGFHDDDNDGVDGCLPEKLVVDDDGVDEVEREEPEEETGDPAGQLVVVVLD